MGQPTLIMGTLAMAFSPASPARVFPTEGGADTGMRIKQHVGRALVGVHSPSESDHR